MSVERLIHTPNLSGSYLSGVRQTLGLTRKQAAERIGCSESTLRKYELEGIKGTTSATMLGDIARAYGIRLQTLIDCAMTPA
ncbi:MAG: helix-turn-helix transcriptional regulator [Atopobiaceae bacterium]|nr:helix-turn-helix transcriptional regulator [Atopobiaceae bacterium]